MILGYILFGIISGSVIGITIIISAYTTVNNKKENSMYNDIDRTYTYVYYPVRLRYDDSYLAE
jgi:hypothetical protein